MSTSTNKLDVYGDYLNPAIDSYSTATKKENPLVLMAEACNNIGKEMPSVKKSVKRRAPICSPPAAAKKAAPSPSPSPWNKQFLYSTSSPSSSYLINSLLSSPTTRAAFVCNWMDSQLGERSCGKRFSDHLHFLEHLYTVHTGIGRWPYSSLQ